MSARNYPRRPRLGPVSGWVEYDDGKGGRTRKAFDNIGSMAARRFYVKASEAGLNPALVRTPAPTV